MEISGPLTFMWRSDLYHDKWTLLAKAWSIIRDDQGKKASQIAPFLAITTPLLSITPPGDYFTKNGYYLEHGELKRADIDLETVPDVETVVSVQDLIDACIKHGYAHNQYLTSGQTTLAMASNIGNFSIKTPGEENTNTSVETIKEQSYIGSVESTESFASKLFIDDQATFAVQGFGLPKEFNFEEGKTKNWLTPY